MSVVLFYSILEQTDTTLLDKDIEGHEEGSAEELLASYSFLNEIFGYPEVVLVLDINTKHKFPH